MASLLWPALLGWTAAALLLCYAVIDLARRDRPGWSASAWIKAAWIGLFVVAPILGPLAYVAVTAAGEHRHGGGERPATDAGRRGADGRLSPQQLAVLKGQIVRY